MLQLSEVADTFLENIRALPPGPGADFQSALVPALEAELKLRNLFAVDRNNPVLSHPYIGLINIFQAPQDIRVSRPRLVTNQDDLDRKFIFPTPLNYRKREGSPCMVDDLGNFSKNFEIFTQRSLSNVNWDNIVVAGGSVLACLTSRAILSSAIPGDEFYGYRNSDVDVFLYGLTPDQAEKKMIAIYDAIRGAVSQPVTCIRTKHALSIYAGFPTRPVQIVLRLYGSPSEILTGFDVDACCFAFDGRTVWGTPRSVCAVMRQCNTADITRRSPSYETRLVKYAERGFEIFVPDLERSEIDERIYQCSALQVDGLARLLILESLRCDTLNLAIVEHLSDVRPDGHIRGQYSGDLRHDSGVDSLLELSDYDHGIASFHIPYGLGWSATRVELELKTKDFVRNVVLKRDLGIHRHAAFLGTMKDCLEGCCGRCPAEENDPEDRGKYVSGRVKFIQDNPGEQLLTGSFQPIDSKDWSKAAYACPWPLAEVESEEWEAVGADDGSGNEASN